MHNCQLRQLDISNAFLHGFLDEEVYIEQPEGFVDKDNPSYVCKLNRSLYGLKQAPRACFSHLSTVLESMGFLGSKANCSLFVKTNGTDKIYVLVYVDEILITGSNLQAVDTTIKTLGKEFSVRDLGSLSYFPCVEVTSQPTVYHLSQRRHIFELLQRAGLANSNEV